jgi:transposase
VIGVERGQEIRERFFRDGESIRSIARALHMSRRTVAKYLESGPPWEYTLNSPRPRPVVDEIEARVRAILIQDQAVRNRKQRQTANRIYERLVEEHAFRGSERAVRRLVAELREELSLEKKEVFLPLQFAYGQAFENDWFEVDAVLDGQLTRTNVFVSRLRASRASWLVAQPTQRLQRSMEASLTVARLGVAPPLRGHLEQQGVIRVVCRQTAQAQPGRAGLEAVAAGLGAWLQRTRRLVGYQALADLATQLREQVASARR